jgi:hypothetical protein
VRMMSIGQSVGHAKTLKTGFNTSLRVSPCMLW